MGQSDLVLEAVHREVPGGGERDGLKTASTYFQVSITNGDRDVAGW